MVEFSEQPISWKIILEPITGNVVISEVDALMCVVLITVEKRMPNAKLVGATECMSAWPRCHTSQSHYSQFQQYFTFCISFSWCTQ
jgi:hypothetical protein